MGPAGAKTVVIIEQDRDEVFSLANRVTVPHPGTLLASGLSDEIGKNQAVKDAFRGETEE